MKQLTQKMKSGEITILDVPTPLLQMGQVLVRNVFSVISAGTEKTKIDMGKKSLLEKAKARPDLVKQVIQKAKTEGLLKTYQTVQSRLNEASPLGYSSVGIVEQIALDVEGIQPGDYVACAGAGYANHAEYCIVPKNLVVKLPGGVLPEEAAFTTIGSIALQGVRLLQPLMGETFLVIGLGLLGQIAVQLLNANGCKVIGFDLDKQKLDLASGFGAHSIYNKEDLLSKCLEATQGVGVDGVLICAGTTSNDPIEQAAEVCRSKGRVVVVGAVGLNIPRDPYFKKEISLVVSRSYGPGRYDPRYEEGGQDYPIDYVRFTEQRNMACILQLMVDKKLNLKPFITHNFPFEEALKAYELIEGNTKEFYLGILLKYSESVPHSVKAFKSRPIKTLHAIEGKINISMIGGGNYATATLLPNLTKNPAVKLQAIMTASGRSAENLVKQFGFEQSIGNLGEILASHSQAVMIATRHNSHASLVCQALKAGKHVFVEKPLALNRIELKSVFQQLQASNQSTLLVGFNRRFSPLVRQAQAFLGKAKIINIRVNAGKIPLDHWVHDPEIGGGRIIGEACHFIDLASALAGAEPISVFSYSLASTQPILLNDNVAIIIKFNNGSIASILYTSEGAKSMPKEYIEIFSEGKSAVIDDFKLLALYKNSARVKTVKIGQDKGQKAMLETWLEGIQAGKAIISEKILCTSSLATIAAVESLAVGQPILIHLADLIDD